MAQSITAHLIRFTGFGLLIIVLTLGSFACGEAEPVCGQPVDGDTDPTDGDTSADEESNAEGEAGEEFPSWNGIIGKRCAEDAQFGCISPVAKAACTGDATPILCSEGCQQGVCLENIRPLEAATEPLTLDLSPNTYMHPRVSGNYMVVAQGILYDHFLGVYRLSDITAIKTLARDGTAECGDWDINGEFVVWADRRNNNNPALPDSSPFFNMDIFLYDIAGDTIYQITTDDKKQNNVRIHGDWVVWEDYRSYEQRNADNGQKEIYGMRISTGEVQRLVSITADIRQTVGTSTLTVPRVNVEFSDLNDTYLTGTILYEKDDTDVPSDIFWLNLNTGEFRQLFLPLMQRTPYLSGTGVTWFGVWGIGEQSRYSDMYTDADPTSVAWAVHPPSSLHIASQYFAFLMPPAEGETDTSLMAYSTLSGGTAQVAASERIEIGNATSTMLVWTQKENDGTSTVRIRQWTACDAGNYCNNSIIDPTTGQCVSQTAQCIGLNDCQIPGCDPSGGCVFTMPTDPNCDDGNPVTTADVCVDAIVENVCQGQMPADYACPDHPDMVRITNDTTSYCIDRYEEILYANEDCTGTRYGAPEDADGNGGDDYPAGFPDLVGDPSVGTPYGQTTTPQTTALYACQADGELPSTYMTWFQARQACENAGKRLCTRDELVISCTNVRETTYPYPHTESLGQDPTGCNGAYQNNGPMAPAKTGSYTRCATYAGVYDLSGNLTEWTGDPAADCGDNAKCALLYGGSFQSGAEIMTCNDNNLLFYTSPASSYIITGARCCLDQ